MAVRQNGRAQHDHDSDSEHDTRTTSAIGHVRDGVTIGSYQLLKTQLFYSAGCPAIQLLFEVVHRT